MTPVMLAQADDSTALFTLIGALGGVLLTGVFALVTAALNNRAAREKMQGEQAQERWEVLRDEKKDAYLKFAKFGNDFVREMNITELQPIDVSSVADEVSFLARIFTELPQPLRGTVDALMEAIARIDLIAPPQVKRVCHEFLDDSGSEVLVHGTVQGNRDRFVRGLSELGGRLDAVLEEMSKDLSS